jgi:hypothetical protein
MKLDYKSILVTSFIALISSGIGGYISYYFTSQSKKFEVELKFKEEKYSSMLVALEGFQEGTTVTSIETKEKFLEGQYQTWLLGSDEVVRATKNLVQFLLNQTNGNAPDREESQKAVGGLVLAMRKDLLGKTDLSYKDFQYSGFKK